MIVTAILLLRSEPYPNGVYDEIEVDSRPIEAFATEFPVIHRLKVTKPPTFYRIIYFVDEEHKMAVVISVRRRDSAYANTSIYRAIIKGVVNDYFKVKGWKYDSH